MLTLAYSKCIVLDDANGGQGEKIYPDVLLLIDIYILLCEHARALAKKHSAKDGEEEKKSTHTWHKFHNSLLFESISDKILV